MAPSRLSESEKQDLVGRYKAGESTAALAEAFGCSPNTVTRTVKALLPPEAYAALKASRQKTGTVTPMPTVAPAAEEESSADAVQDKTTMRQLQHWPWTMPTTSVKTPMR